MTITSQPEQSRIFVLPLTRETYTFLCSTTGSLSHSEGIFLTLSITPTFFPSQELTHLNRCSSRYPPRGCNSHNTTSTHLSPPFLVFTQILHTAGSLRVREWKVCMQRFSLFSCILFFPPFFYLRRRTSTNLAFSAVRLMVKDTRSSYFRRSSAACAHIWSCDLRKSRAKQTPGCDGSGLSCTHATSRGHGGCCTQQVQESATEVGPLNKNMVIPASKLP